MIFRHSAIVTVFLFSGVIILIFNLISSKLTKGRFRPSAIAIFLDLVFAYIGSEKGISGITAFGGIGIPTEQW